jgi:hypothetical protein
MALERIRIDCSSKEQTKVLLTQDEEARFSAYRQASQAKEDTRVQQEKNKTDKKASLLTQPNKSVTVQDLLDLGLI